MSCKVSITGCNNLCNSLITILDQILFRNGFLSFSREHVGVQLMNFSKLEGVPQKGGNEKQMYDVYEYIIIYGYRSSAS